jgi:heme/copper-type cytochrome/quinol oxidase subunit 2
MRVAVLWSVLAIANLTWLAMLATLWRARSSAMSGHVRSSGTVELAWAIVPWLITALAAAPTVHHMLATGQPVKRSLDAGVLAPTPLAPCTVSVPPSQSRMENENVAPGHRLFASARRENNAL